MLCLLKKGSLDFEGVVPTAGSCFARRDRLCSDSLRQNSTCVVTILDILTQIYGVPPGPVDDPSLTVSLCLAGAAVLPLLFLLVGCGYVPPTVPLKRRSLVQCSNGWYLGKGILHEEPVICSVNQH